MRASVQASLSRLGFYEQTLCLHMGCIISTSTLWESTAINAAVLCCDKPLLSACICISYQLSGCNNRIGHHLTCIRRQPSRAIRKKKMSPSFIITYNPYYGNLFMKMSQQSHLIQLWRHKGDYPLAKDTERYTIHIRGHAGLTSPSAVLSR